MPYNQWWILLLNLDMLIPTIIDGKEDMQNPFYMLFYYAYIIIYTDGSMTDKETGYDFCIFTNFIESEVMFQNSVFQAEL